MDYGRGIRRKRKRRSILPAHQQDLHCQVPTQSLPTSTSHPYESLLDLPQPSSKNPCEGSFGSTTALQNAKRSNSNGDTDKLQSIGSHGISIAEEIDDVLFSSTVLISSPDATNCQNLPDDVEVEDVVCHSIPRRDSSSVISPDTSKAGDGKGGEMWDEAEEEDTLFDLYPEDFSFILNSSAYLLPEGLEDRISESAGKNLNECTRNSGDQHSMVVIGNDQCDSAAITSIPISPTISQAQLPLTPSPPLCYSLPPPHPSTSSPLPPPHPSTSSPLNPHHPFTSSPLPPNVKLEQMAYPVNTFYGLPLAVQSLLEEYRGITKLYDWQDNCLHLPSVHNGSNLIYSLPTSGGKTLVAELIILRQLLLHGKDSLFIMPFVSIVQEKVRELTPFASALGFAVDEYAANRGTIPPRKRRKKRVVYIATIEKANSLINSLIEQQRVSDLGLIVIDELHMLGDGSVRGATLEACLAKIQFSAGNNIQLVGMSATLHNISELAVFMRAQVYSSDFRPVELVEYMKLGRTLYSISINSCTDESVDYIPVREIPSPPQALSQLDPDQLSSLVLEVVPHGSCLVFCPTKKNCQNVSLLLSKCFPNSLRNAELSAARHSLLQLLSIEASGVCPILQQTIPFGVAYHHSGLTADERKVIEEGYLDGTLSVLACTSTLAAGINLPAKRVILRTPFISNHVLSRSQYKQMVGRAGRSGMCDKGESILIIQDSDKTQVNELLSGPCEKCSSSLLVDDSAALLSLILTLIGLKLIKNFEHLWFFLTNTLLYVQVEHGYLKDCCHQAVAQLAALGYITLEAGTELDDSTYFITTLGRATYRGCLPVKWAHQVYQDLVKGHKCLVLATDLHLLYLATPPELGFGVIQPNWMVYFEMLTDLGADELKVAELVGVEPGILSKKATGTAGKMALETAHRYFRFYLSLMLYFFLKMKTPDAVWRVANTFHCSRGFIQTVLNSTSTFISSLFHFTQEIPELWSLALLFPAVGKKLSFSSSLDLIPLMEIPGIKQGRAHQLISVGIRTPQQLAMTDPRMLCQNIQNLYFKQAKMLVNSAKVFLSEQADALLEEAEELMTLLPNALTAS